MGGEPPQGWWGQPIAAGVHNIGKRAVVVAVVVVVDAPEFATAGLQLEFFELHPKRPLAQLVALRFQHQARTFEWAAVCC